MVKKQQGGEPMRRPSLKNVDDASSKASREAGGESTAAQSASLESQGSESDAMRIRKANLSIDTELRQLHDPALLSSGSPLRGVARQASRSPSSPVSPLSPRTRDRGYSLRTSLFKKAAATQALDASSSIEIAELGAPAGASNGTHLKFAESAKKAGSSSTVSPVTESKKKPFASKALPNYDLWAERVRKRSIPERIKAPYEKACNFLFRRREIPTRKDGRHIPLAARRKIPLIDERTGKLYIANTIRSTRYNGWDFFPRQLFFQFSKLANFYFLLISILQMIPGLSTTGTYTTIIPLIFFVLLSITKEGYDDYRRYVLDKAENNKETSVLRAGQPVAAQTDVENQLPSEADATMQWAVIKWQDVAVGDVIRLKRDDLVPADVVLLHSDGFNGIAYIDTMALDGETNLKAKQASPALSTICTTLDGVVECDALITAEDPNPDLYHFDGKVTIAGRTLPLTTAEILYRGSTLRNTSEVIGMVINTGEECKIRKNANKTPRIKRPSMQAIVNKVVFMVVLFVLALAIYLTAAYEIWSSDKVATKAWYLNGSGVPFREVIVGFIILLNTMIPLSLYVSLEIVKLGQLVLMADIAMYDPVSDTPMEARTSTINEELGQISHIFSDKTGTLTDNVMRFRKFSVCGYAFLHDFDIEKEETSKSEALKKHSKSTILSERKHGKKRVSFEHGSGAAVGLGRSSSVASQWKSPARPMAPQAEIRSEFLLRYLQNKPNSVFARKARSFILYLALCNTCLPEKQENGDIDFQAASPDELALVRAAQDLGYILIDRPAQTIILRTFPRGLGSPEVREKYEVLDVIEFTSKRKRMSVVVKFPNDRICIICKGADSVIAARLKHASLAIQKATEVETRAERKKSLEAERALRRMSESESPRESFARPSFSVRRKSFAAGRLSMQSSRLEPIRDGLDSWLRERETDGSRESVDNRSAYITPRTSVALDRISFSPSEPQNIAEDGSPYDDMIDEAVVLDESLVFERCFQHMNDFASEGLRTLLYAHKFIDADEYAQWKKLYLDASTSLANRQALIDAAGDMIEQNFDLSGATAIEDKLQDKLPETIDKLRRANIKMWMLTGDKRETAINVGHSCRLIKEYSQLTILDSESGDVEQHIASSILEISRGVAHSVVVIDGQTLGDLDSREASSMLFLDLAVVADSVICCRASPAQKAELVKKIRLRLPKSVTLAIGDGANDIAMIQEAHVGIGITGKEGMMAARCSDYSIAQFRFLQRLLLVHGRWNYVRTGKYILGTFWKEMLFYLHQALYQRWAGYTGTSLFESVSLSMFNTLFTSLAVILVGIFDQDLSADTLLAVPELYIAGQRNGSFKFKKYFAWMFMAASDVTILFFVMLGLWGQSRFTNDDTAFAMGDLSFSAAIVVINTKLLILEMHNKTLIPLAGWIITIGGWVLFNLILSVAYKATNKEYYVHDGLTSRFGRSLQWWLVLLAAIVTTLTWEITVASIKKSFFPSDVNVFQELEKDLVVRRRFRDAVEGRGGEGVGGGGDGEGGDGVGRRRRRRRRSSEVRERERERDVQELLEKPRVMHGHGGRGGDMGSCSSGAELLKRNRLSDNGSSSGSGSGLVSPTTAVEATQL